jgi:hypothetical protein
MSTTHLEVLNMLGWHLGDFQQADMAIIVNDGTTLDISPGLVGQLHQELGFAFNKVLQDAEIDIGTKIVNVGNKDVLLAGGNEFVKQTRVLECIENVTVPGRIPIALVTSRGTGNGQEALATNTGVAGLVEREDLNVVVRVLLDDTLGVIIGVERVHEHERNVDFVLRVEVLIRMIGIVSSY